MQEEGEGETRVRKESKKTNRKGKKAEEQSDHEFLIKRVAIH